MKVCIITNTFSDTLIGGSNIYSVNLNEELIKNNIETVVITASPNKKDEDRIVNGIHVYSFRPLNISTFYTIGKESIIKQGIWTLLDIYSWYSYNRILSILKKEKPNVVHIHMPIDVTLSAFDAVKKMKLPLVFTVQDYLLLCRRITLLHGSGKICVANSENILCKIYRAITKRILKSKPDIAIFPSQFILNMFQNNNFFKHSKKTVIPYGIRLNDKQGPDRTRIPREIFNILYIGSLTKHKGIEVLIKAVKQIEDKNLALSIVGEGVYRKTLTELAKNDNRIKFYGKIDNKHIDQFYNLADVLVVPSVWFEVLGIVIQEAFRSGVPVIASNIGGIPELIKHNYNGFLFEPGNHVQLADLIKECMTNRERLTDMGRNARESVRKFDMNEHIRKIILSYEDAIDINSRS